MTTTTSHNFAGLPAVPPNDPSLTAPENSTVPRKIKLHFEAQEQSEGVGARVRRSIGTAKLRNFSPFLMLDHFKSSPGSGFPDHPHRGQETITYMLSGETHHEDFAGNTGTLHAGDLQFMTAGRGIVHAEIPSPDHVSEGMQLWVDLPQHLKMCEPRYRDLGAAEIPSVDADDGKVTVKVISGRSYGVDSVQELAYTPVWLLDVTVKAGGKFAQNVPASWNTFAYLLKGAATFGAGEDAQYVPTHHNVVFEQKGDAVHVEVDPDAEEDCRFILVSGIPLDQKGKSCIAG